MAINIPIRVILRLLLFLIAQYTSWAMDEPWTWNCVLIVLIAAESRVNKNMYVNHLGIALLINVGIILSTFPPAAWIAICPVVW